MGDRERPGRVATPAAVLFDLDGTLVDSVPDLAAAADATLAELGRPPVGVDRVRLWVGNGVERLVHRLLTGDMHRDAAPEAHAAARASFMTHYTGLNGTHTRVFPGARECLACLRAQDIPAGCVTNKPRTFTLPLLEHLGLLEHFAVVVGGDDTVHSKPHPQPVLHALRALGVGPPRALMVGDSVHDLAAGRAAGLRVIAVSYGYNHGRPIAESRPLLVIDSLAELPALIGLACASRT